MAVFMDESGVVARNRHFPIRETLRSHLKTFTFFKCLFPNFQFSIHQIHNFLNEQHTLVSDCKASLAGTATYNCIEKGGDATKYRFSSLMFLRKSLLA